MARENNCPILIEKKIHLANAGYGVDKNWVKDICTKCPNWNEETQTGECFEDTRNKREVKNES